MLSKKKKIVILSVMAVLLVVSGYLNIALNNSVSNVSNNNNTTQASFFATYRTDRINTRNQEIMYLDAIIENESSTDEAKKTAEDKKVSLVQTMELELVIEGLIKAKGFDDVVVTNTTNNVNVIVKSAELTAGEVSQIVSVIEEQTGKSIDNIKIIPVE